MNENERILKVIYGTQESSLDYIKRFSMCDCLTLYMPDTYTAMGAGLELFNNKFIAGENIHYHITNRQNYWISQTPISRQTFSSSLTCIN